MKLSQAKEYLPLVQAAAEGKTIQYSVCGIWYDAEAELDFIQPPHEYRIKPSPRLRPWKPEEVPVGALIRGEHCQFRGIIVGAQWNSQNQCAGIFCGFKFIESGQAARDGWQYSLDHGKTWLPCGGEVCE